MKLTSITLAITVTTCCGIEATAQEATVSGKVDNYQYVDLGLKSGLKWATCDVGASKPNQQGSTYMWAETKPQTPIKNVFIGYAYNWNYELRKYNYKFFVGTPIGAMEGYYFPKDTVPYEFDAPSDSILISYSRMTKYSTNDKDGINDGLREIEPIDDAATTEMGGKWRIPTSTEWQELIDGCNWEWNGDYHKGTSKANGNTILILGIEGYWSSTLDTSDCHMAKVATIDHFEKDKTNIQIDSKDRCDYYAIRAVNGERVKQAPAKKVYNYGATVSGKLGNRTYVDLGLKSGTKWATYNVGAKQPEECGAYYSWGETKPKKNSAYSWEGYKFFKGKRVKYKDGITDEQFTSYNWGGSYLKEKLGAELLDTTPSIITKYSVNIDCGTYDKLTTLEPKDDAATTNWGKEWCMPTKDQMKELIDGCYWEWSQNFNHSNQCGFKGTSKTNGNVIFLPTGLEKLDESYLWPVIDTTAYPVIEGLTYKKDLYWTSSLDVSTYYWENGLRIEGVMNKEEEKPYSRQEEGFNQAIGLDLECRGYQYWFSEMTMFRCVGGQVRAVVKK